MTGPTMTLMMKPSPSKSSAGPRRSGRGARPAALSRQCRRVLLPQVSGHAVRSFTPLVIIPRAPRAPLAHAPDLARSWLLTWPGERLPHAVTGSAAFLLSAAG
jgi:hypothetical protein